MMNQNDLKICDLGFAQRIKGNIIDPAQGTLGIMAPEIIEKKKVGIQADMFSLGVIFYQLMFGELPFSNQSKDIFLKEVKNSMKKLLNYQEPPQFKNGISITEKAMALIVKMLQYNPDDRIQFDQIYNDPLFQIENSIKSTIQSSKYFLLQSKVNMEQNSGYYKVNQSLKDITFESLQKSLMNNQEQSIHSIEEEKQVQDLSQILFIQNNRLDIKKNLHRSLELFMAKIDSQFFIAKVIEQIQKIIHFNNTNPYYPLFILIKKLYIENQMLIKKIREKENIFNCKYINQLYEDQEFLRLYQKLKQDAEIISIHFNVYKNDLLQLKFEDKDIKNEFSLQPSVNFDQTYKKVLYSYFKELEQIVNVNNSWNGKQNLMIFILDCLRFDSIFQNEVFQYSSVFIKQTLLSFNFDHYFKIFDKYNYEDKQRFIVLKLQKYDQSQ